ncbi:hypothetical protein TRFO_23556 [Tritrichomonas foetus]|uniref:Uncharacterized protein n=1 Tax=Tritrichomonas foetus TaxID=1144522 RepID=A0A1J4KB18_9EUKA|nr:hypothetical protein TRFO_23556 [Tritrichomonas foetus]|eukprot:OHT08096.1 hypothetical protein TRFO_23556 [Tritrichomonas foetus]
MSLKFSNKKPFKHNIMMFTKTKTPNEFTLPARASLPHEHDSEKFQKDANFQFLRVSLLNNPATSIPKNEIKRLFELRDSYNDQVQAAEARYEIEAFERKIAGKPPPSMPEIPFPSGLNYDIVRANEPSSAVRMYSPTKTRSNRKSNIKARAVTSLTTNRQMIHRCACCNPDPPTSPHVPVKPRNGSSHWQVLDEPLLPSQPPNTYVEPSKPSPFYNPSKKSLNITIPIIVDDLVEKTETMDEKFENTMKHKIMLEKRARTKLLHNRALANREAMRKRQQDTSDLANRSGQLKAQSRLSTRNSNIARARAKERESQKVSSEDLEAMEELKQYDEAMWNNYRLQRKDDPISRLLSQDVFTMQSGHQSLMKLPTITADDYLGKNDPSLIIAE